MGNIGGMHADHAEYADCSVSAESARAAWKIAKTPVNVTC